MFHIFCMEFLCITVALDPFRSCPKEKNIGTGSTKLNNNIQDLKAKWIHFTDFLKIVIYLKSA